MPPRHGLHSLPPPSTEHPRRLGRRIQPVRAAKVILREFFLGMRHASLCALLAPPLRPHGVAIRPWVGTGAWPARRAVWEPRDMKDADRLGRDRGALWPDHIFVMTLAAIEVPHVEEWRVSLSAIARKYIRRGERCQGGIVTGRTKARESGLLVQEYHET
jgi:hypothetical protein